MTLDAGGVILGDGAIVDTARSVIYVMNPEAGIDAVSLENGEVLWTSTEAARPLLIVDDLLLAQGEPAKVGELSLVTLERGSGSLHASAALELPTDVWAGVADGPRSSFRAFATRQGNAAGIDWRSIQLKKNRELQGYLPSPGQDEGPRPDAPAVGEKALRGERGAIEAVRPFEQRRGALSFDLATGRSETLAVDKASASRPALSEVRLLEGVAGRQFLSADGRHILVSDLVSPLVGYSWSVYTRGGDLVGRTEHRFSAAPFLVAGTSIVFESQVHAARREDGGLIEQPLSIRVVDLASGAEVFAKSIGELEYEGPFPP